MATRWKLIAESISVIMMIGIAVIAGYVIYRSFTYQYRQQYFGVRRVGEEALKRIGERLIYVDGYLRVINISHKELVLTLYNGGDYDITVVEVRLPGIVFIAPGNTSIKVIAIKTNYVLAKDKVTTMRLTVIDETVGYAPGMIVTIVLKTDTGRFYEYNVKVVRGA